MVRLIVAYLLPTILLLSIFGWWVYRETALALEGEFGRRLISIAQAAAIQILPESVAFLTPEDDESRTARRLHHKLAEFRDRIQVARIFIIDEKLRSISDSNPQVHIGDHFYHAEADMAEIHRVFKGGLATSVLFQGEDGRLYKTGYAPIRSQEGVVAAIGVEGNAEFFSVLARLKQTFLFSWLILALLIVGTSVLVARRLTRPLRLLSQEAIRIGNGQMELPIQIQGRDEVGLLGKTMNQMRQDLLHREQELQMMLSGIAHEVRNPLGGIAIFSGLLREELADNPNLSSYVERIERELESLKRVVNDFLDYARRLPPTLITTNLFDLGEDVLELLRSEAAAKQVKVHFESPKKLASVVDKEQIRRALINLVRNAIQSTPAQGEVVLSMANQDEDLLMEIRDTGSGIPKEHLEKLFTPFFTTREQGTGLGLALVKKIVDLHHGKIDVESQPGRGTVFRLVLPRGEDYGEDTHH